MVRKSIRITPFHRSRPIIRRRGETGPVDLDGTPLSEVRSTYISIVELNIGDPRYMRYFYLQFCAYAIEKWPFSGTYPLIYSDCWSFYMRIHYINASVFLDVLSLAYYEVNLYVIINRTNKHIFPEPILPNFFSSPTKYFSVFFC